MYIHTVPYVHKSKALGASHAQVDSTSEIFLIGGSFPLRSFDSHQDFDQDELGYFEDPSNGKTKAGFGPDLAYSVGRKAQASSTGTELEAI